MTELSELFVFSLNVR